MGNTTSVVLDNIVKETNCSSLLRWPRNAFEASASLCRNPR